MYKNANFWKQPCQTTKAIAKLKSIRKIEHDNKLKREDGILTSVELQELFNLGNG